MKELDVDIFLQECEKVLYELENIDDELDDFGITLVTTEDIKYAGRRLKVRKFPALGMFRNGRFLLYEGPLKVRFEWKLEILIHKRMQKAFLGVERLYCSSLHTREGYTDTLRIRYTKSLFQSDLCKVLYILT